MRLSGGTLAVPAGTATVSGTLNWDAQSTIGGPGTLQVGAGGTINVGGSNAHTTRGFPSTSQSL